VQKLILTLVSMLRATLMVAALTVVLGTGYVVKSALGINMFPGRSAVVHDLLYPMAISLKAAIKTASPV
jgi:hypothetical protein